MKVDLAKVAAGITAAYAIGQFGSQIYRGLKKGKNLMTTVHDVSPTQAVAGNIVSARCYIEKSCVHIDIMPKLYRAIHVLYCGSLTMLLENRAAQRRGLLLEDSIGAAQTNFHYGLAEFCDTVAALESLQDHYPSMEFLGMGEKTFQDKAQDLTDRVNEKREHLHQIENPSHSDPETLQHPPGGATHVGVDLNIEKVKSALLPVGQIIRVTTQEPTADGKSNVPTTVSILVRIEPYDVSTKVMEDILNYGAELPEYIKKVKRRTEEVKFWNDYVHAAKDPNLLEEIGGDKQEFREFLKDLKKREANFKANRADSLFMMSIGSLSANLANTILIVTEDTLKKVKKELGYDFMREETRDKFFKKTYCMMLVVIDTYYNRVSIYMNGIPIVGHYSFKDFESEKTIDSNALLQLFTQAGNQSMRAARF